MSGARLETLGQVRNVYPYAVNTGIRATLIVPTATFIGESAIRIDKSEIPFDRGPDKSSRTFISINGVSFVLTPDAGTTTQAIGLLYYRGSDGKRIYLAAVANTLATPLAVNSVLKVTPALPITAESVDNIGFFGFENIGSIVGTATSIVITCAINVGMYGDYAEPDFNELLKIQGHEHLGMDIVSYNDIR